MKISTLKAFLVLFFICSVAKATHIVGGEFELKYLQGENYSLSLKLYFDEVNGDPNILTNPTDQRVDAYIFSKKTNAVVKVVTLYKTSTDRVNYTDPLCARAELRTLVLLYSETITLPPNQFSDPAGYYIVWERCCRNDVISNINNPGLTGQAFYLEFPPVTKNGSPFINSSPRLFPPLSDYGCVNKPFYYDFSGNDSDGDVLKYSLVTPFAGFSSKDYPIVNPSPAPYPKVSWVSNVNENNMIPGSPSLNIEENTGRLFVIPVRTGLFVFGVKCEEFRNGVKIGEVRRDFQMMVLDCPVNDPPSVSVTPPGDKIFQGKSDTVNIKVGEERCFKFSVKDKQLSTTVNVDLVPLNFPNNFISPTKYTKSFTSTNDSLTFEVCFPDCPLPNGRPYLLQVLARDNGCSLPLVDTVTLQVVVEPLPNQAAVLTSNLDTEEILVKVGETINFDLLGTDPDKGNLLKLFVEAVDFELDEFKMVFENKEGLGEINSKFSWAPSCPYLNLNRKDEFELFFVLEELDDCKHVHRVKKRVKIKVEADPNTPPVVFIDKYPEIPAITAYVGQKIEFNVIAEDPDNYFIALDGKGRSFNFTDVGMQFAGNTSTSKVSAPFSWEITCDYLYKNKGIYEIDFVVYDRSCYGQQYDTLAFKIEIKDIPSGQEEFIPPNVFTPNGDGKNDFFTLDVINNGFETPSQFALPIDVCDNKFEEIIIVNRWGNPVFKEPTRSFKWDGDKYAAGTYFYTIKYTKKIYKGTISILR